MTRGRVGERQTKKPETHITLRRVLRTPQRDNDLLFG
jgi:hypothetical protein